AGRRPHRQRRLTPAPGAPILPATSRRAGCERDEYPSGVGREIRWLVETGATAAANGPGSLRTERRVHGARAPNASRVGSGAERQRYRAAPIGGSSARRSRSAASPNEGGTAEGTTFRPGTNWSFLILGPGSPRRLASMSTTDPLSLTEAKRLAGNADTLLLRATRPADLETPIGAFLRLDDGATPAYLLESVEGGERLGRYSFLGVGPRRLLEVRDGIARTQTRPVTVEAYHPELPVNATPAPDPLDAIRAFVPRRRVQPTEGMPRFTGGAVGALAYDAVSTFEPTV